MWIALLAQQALAAQPKKRPPDDERGEELYERSCWHCHGERALGDGPAAAAMTVPVPALAGIDASRKPELVEVILEGRGDMPAFREEIGIHDARRIVTWLVSLDPDPQEEEEEREEEAAEEEPEEKAPAKAGD